MRRGASGSSRSAARTPASAAGVGRTTAAPLSPSSRIWSPSRHVAERRGTRPSTGTPIARATITTCAVSEPSSSTTPFSRRRSYSSSSAGPRLRAIRMVSWRSPVCAAVPMLARDDPQQPVGEILQVVHPVGSSGSSISRIRIAGALLDPLDRRLGGQAGVDRLVDAPRPAFVVGEHLVGLEHLLVLAADAELGLAGHRVDLLAHLVEGDDRPAGARPRYPRRRSARS